MGTLNLSLRKKRTSMERIFRVRMANIRLLVRSYKSQAELARVLGIDNSRLTHIAGENPTRTIGEKAARDMEVKLGLTPGWLDMIR
jgi:hypothetical protein